METNKANFKSKIKNSKLKIKIYFNFKLKKKTMDQEPKLKRRLAEFKEEINPISENQDYDSIIQFSEKSYSIVGLSKERKLMRKSESQKIS